MSYYFGRKLNSTVVATYIYPAEKLTMIFGDCERWIEFEDTLLAVLYVLTLRPLDFNKANKTNRSL